MTIKSLKECKTLEEYQETMSLKRRVQQQALAILKRAKDAGIPPQDMRIPQDEFEGMLDPSYFSLVEEKLTLKDSKEKTSLLCKELFTIPEKILSVPFIIIDGGNPYERKRAGFALLFRAIAWDKIGKHQSFVHTVHSLNTWEGSNGQNRTEIVSELKEYDILFISECSVRDFKPTLEGGSFFDDVLQDREVEGKTTILTFPSITSKGVINSTEDSSDHIAGQYMSMFSQADSEKRYNNMLRIRVKSNG